MEVGDVPCGGKGCPLCGMSYLEVGDVPCEVGMSPIGGISMSPLQLEDVPCGGRDVPCGGKGCPLWR